MRSIYLLFALSTLAACSRQAPPPRPAPRPVTDVAPGQVDIGGVNVSLPQRLGEWARPATARRVVAETIFDYMDGAGELYLAYRFDHLDVFEYKAQDATLGTILAEIYSMKTADDAFGLLSNDWGGEAVAFDPGSRASQQLRAVPARRALYGAGLLRMLVGDRYVRILASRETDDSRQAVLRLGETIMRTGASVPDAAAPPPAVLRGFDVEVDAKRPIRLDRTCFFRSHLVLNSQYFLASQDILGLGPDVAAATTEYSPVGAGERPLRVILVRYPSAERARAGLSSFAQAYLPGVAGNTPAVRGEAKIEHGWVGWTLNAARRDLTIVLDAPERALARRFANVLMPGSGGRM